MMIEIRHLWLVAIDGESLPCSKNDIVKKTHIKSLISNAVDVDEIIFSLLVKWRLSTYFPWKMLITTTVVVAIAAK